MNNHGITALIVLFFVVLVGYWLVNYTNVTSVAQTVPVTSQVAGVYGAYPATAPATVPVATYPRTYVAPAAPIYAYPAATYPTTYAAAPVYSYPAYYPTYNTAPRTTYVTYPIAKSTSYSSSYYSSPGYYNSYTTSTIPGGTYPGQNCYTQPNGAYTCTYQQQY